MEPVLCKQGINVLKGLKCNHILTGNINFKLSQGSSILLAKGLREAIPSEWSSKMRIWKRYALAWLILQAVLSRSKGSTSKPLADLKLAAIVSWSAQSGTIYFAAKLIVPLGSSCSSPDSGAPGAIWQVGSGDQFGYRITICGRVGYFSAPSVLWFSSLQGCTHTAVEKGHEKGDRQGKEKLRARLFFLATVLVYARSWWCGTKVSEFTEDPYKAKRMFSKDCWGQIEEENDGNWF